MRKSANLRAPNVSLTCHLGVTSLLIGLTLGVPPSLGASVPFPASQRVDLLYLLANPYPRLYVQVDAVEGCEPDEASITAVRSTLSRYCDKPGGIEIVRTNIIPREKVRGLAETMVAIHHMQGPPDSPKRPPAAYMYILFYNSGALGTSITREPRAPYVPTDYPCAVFVDTAYMGPHRKRLEPRLLTHELYHTLGLVKISSRGDENHCRSRSCLMYHSYSLDECLYRGGDRNYGICGKCKRDLQTAKASAPNTQMSFQGPILVRRESGYWVGLLPSYVGLYFRPVTVQDRPTILQAARNSGHRVKCIENSVICYDQTTFLQTLGSESQKYRALEKALEDPNPNVTRAAETLAKSLGNQGR